MADQGDAIPLANVEGDVIQSKQVSMVTCGDQPPPDFCLLGRYNLACPLGCAHAKLQAGMFEGNGRLVHESTAEMQYEDGPG